MVSLAHIIGLPWLKRCDYCGREYSGGGGGRWEGLGTHRILVRGDFCCAECQEASENEVKNDRPRVGRLDN